MGQGVSSSGEATLILGPPLPTTDSTVPFEPATSLSSPLEDQLPVGMGLGYVMGQGAASPGEATLVLGPPVPTTDSTDPYEHAKFLPSLLKVPLPAGTGLGCYGMGEATLGLGPPLLATDSTDPF